MSALRKEVLNFPTREIQVVSFVNERNERLERNYRAKAYSRKCALRAEALKAKERHEDLMMFISGLCVFAMIATVWVVGYIL